MASKNYDDMTVAELKEAASKHDLPGRSAMSKEDLIAALKDADAAAEAGESAPTRAPRDNRRILKGVQFHQAGAIKTFAGDDAETLDSLEKTLTPEQCERLIENGSLEGDWSPSGEPQAPMPVPAHSAKAATRQSK